MNQYDLLSVTLGKTVIWSRAWKTKPIWHVRQDLSSQRWERRACLNGTWKYSSSSIVLHMDVFGRKSRRAG